MDAQLGMKNLRWFPPMLITAAVVAGPAHGQEGPAIDENQISMGMRVSEIVVTGLSNSLGDQAYNISEISLEGPQRIENALREIPGLQQFRRSDARSANPTSQGITLRGLGGNASSRALLLLDGVPQADPFGGWVAWPGYDALPLAQARVRRGGGSGADGQGAIAGTIELFSKDVDNLIDLGASYGSRDSIDADLVIGRELGQGQVTISGNYARGDGFIPIIKGQRGTVDRGAKYEQAGVAVRVVAPLTDDTQLQANVRAFTDDRERGFAYSDNHNDGVDASLRLVNDASDWQWSALAYIQIRNFDVSFGGVSADRNMVSRVFEQFNVPSTGLGARVELRPPVSDDIELRIGGDWRRTVGVTNENFFFADNDTPRRSRRAGGNSSTYGGFIEASAQLSPALLVTGGGRIDFWSIDNGFRREIELVSPFPGAVRSDDHFADRHGTEYTGRGGFAFDATDELTLRGAAYLGWRLPTLNELFRPFRVGDDATAANELLRPERVKGAELGLDWAGNYVSFGVTGFYNQLDNAIANVTLARGPGVFPGVGFVSGNGSYSRRQNLNSIRSKGVEVEGEFDLASLINGLSLRTAYSYVDAEVDSDGTAAAIDGLRPAQIPKHNASASLNWADNDGNEFGIAGRYTGQQFDDDLNDYSLSDAFTVDGHMSFALRKNLLIEGRVENLFNSRVEAAIDGNQIIERAFARTFWIGLRSKIE